MNMNNTMEDILEMHGRISNDPWCTARRLRDQDARDLRYLQDDERKKNISTWHSKANTNNRMDRFLVLQKQECEMLRNVQQEKYHDKIRRNNESLENTMGKYLEKEKNESLYQDRYSQYLRENDPQLRKLASQLREAHVNKIRLAQIDEKERNKNSVALADIPYVRALEERIKEDEEKERLELFQEEERKYKLRRLLQQQMKERIECNEIENAREEDKIRIEAIIKADTEEINAEKEREFEKKMKLRKSYNDYLVDKEKEIIRQKQLLLDEENRLKAYSQFTDTRKDELERLKRMREGNLNEVQKRLGELLNRKQRDIDEFEEARQDVAVAQSEMQAFRFEQTERENKERAKIKYIAELDKCKEANQQAEFEEKMRNHNLDMEIAKVNSLKVDEERERQIKQKEINTIFKNECQADIDYKRLEKERCLEEEREQQRLYQIDDTKYNNDVEKERIVMLKEMAPHLYPGCIPRGMLREEDIQYLDDPLKNFLLNKKSYPDPDIY